MFGSVWISLRLSRGCAHKSYVYRRTERMDFATNEIQDAREGNSFFLSMYFIVQVRSLATCVHPRETAMKFTRFESSVTLIYARREREKYPKRIRRVLDGGFDKKRKKTKFLSGPRWHMHYTNHFLTSLRYERILVGKSERTASWSVIVGKPEQRTTSRLSIRR